MYCVSRRRKKTAGSLTILHQTVSYVASYTVVRKGNRKCRAAVGKAVAGGRYDVEHKIRTVSTATMIGWSERLLR